MDTFIIHLHTHAFVDAYTGLESALRLLPRPSQLEETWEPARPAVSPGPLSLSPVGSLEMGTWLHLVISESIAPVQPQTLDVLNPAAMCGCDSHQLSVPSIHAPLRLSSGIHLQHVLHVPVLLGPPSAIQEDLSLQVVTRGLRTHGEN